MSRRDPPPSPEQIAAVIRFADKHGRFWKDELRRLWLRDCCASGLGVMDAHLMQQLRNWHGPTWLNRFSLARAKAEMATAIAEG